MATIVPKVFCQSCSMPIDDVKLRGTEKDGNKSNDYCMFCYANGQFINPDASLEQMKVIVTDALKKQNAPAGTAEMAISTLPYLKRWRGKK